MVACKGKHTSDAQKATVHDADPSLGFEHADTVKVDLSASNVRWKGTKLRGTRKHEGDVQLLNAYLLTEGGRVTGGNFAVSMKTLRVTDIPAHESEPRNNLMNHLKGTDFFDVEKYPRAVFEITNIVYLSADSLKVTGNLNVKDVIKSIAFSAVNKGKTFSTRFTFNRFQWNISYIGNVAERTLVDRDIELSINLKIK
jgi:polyisoprenoid-binding protein YceI